MYNWNKVFNDGEYSYVLKKQSKSKLNKDVIKAVDALMDSYLDRFGFEKKVKEYNNLRFKSAKLKLQYIKTDNRMLINKINKLENRIEELKVLIFSQNSNDFNENHVILQKWYGQRIDLKTTTVIEYRSIQNTYEQEHKKARHSGRRRSR